ncbi:MAG: hypothetical protein GXX94_07395 [Chloroflexi bacterium]|nr:hypothetical protein [Chloroflexota bacterium]
MNKRVLAVALLTVFLLLAMGCVLTTLMNRLTSGNVQTTRERIAIEIPSPSRATPYPTLTPRPQADSPTSLAPSTFRVELSESDISALVGEEGLSRDGLQVRNLRVTITEQQVIARFDAAHASSGLSGEMTVIGVPQVVDGKLYLQVIDFSLGSSFSGFTRLIANALVESVLASYNTGDGIPVPIEGVNEVTSVELLAGRMVVTGTHH